MKDKHWQLLLKVVIKDQVEHLEVQLNILIHMIMTIKGFYQLLNQLIPTSGIGLKCMCHIVMGHYIKDLENNPLIIKTKIFISEGLTTL